MNRLDIGACIIERDVLRHSPAGIPISTCVLQHRSSQMEAGQERQVEAEIAAVAIGKLAGQLDTALLGKAYRFHGFLAQTRRNSRGIVFHITGFDQELED